MKGLEAYIIETTDSLAQKAFIGEYNRVVLSVGLERRYRDQTLSDRFGYFSSRGIWRDLPDMQDLRTFNIVQPTIRATKAVITQANPKIEIQPRFEKNYTQQLAAEAGRVLVEQDEREFWTSSFLEQIGDRIQIDPGCFVKTDWCEKSEKTAKVTNYEKQEFISSGEAVCPTCEYSQIVSEMIMPDEHGMATVPCRECGNEAIVSSFPEMETVDFPNGQTDVNVGKAEITLHSALQFIADENGTSGGNLMRGKWLCHRYLMYEYELKAKYRNLNLTDSVSWSFATKWLYALNKGHAFVGGMQDGLLKEFELHEVCDWYFVPEVFANRIEESDCNIGNIKIKRGENILKKLKTNLGICYRRVGNEIAEVFAKDFRRTFQYISFLKDAHAFWALPQTVLMTCQDLITEYLTIQADIASRNVEGTTVINSEYLNEEDLLQPVVRTKKAYPTDKNFQPAMHIPAMPISPVPMQMVEMSMTMKDKLSGVSSIMMGQLPGNEPYSSVALQREQSLGLLSTALHSIAEAKKNSDKEVLRLRKEKMSDAELLELIEYNENLSIEHIKAFKNCNIDSDLAIDYVQGTAVPRSLFERELSLRQQMNDFIALAQLNPELITSTTVNDFLNGFSEITNSIELDINNIKADKQLAQKRYQTLKEFSEKLPENPDEEILTEILDNPLIAPLTIEGHSTHKEFFADRLRSLALQEARNYALETLCKMMYAKHDQLELEFAQYQMRKQQMMSQPVMQQQQQQGSAAQAEQMQMALAQKAEENRMDTEKLAQEEAIKAQFAQKD